MAGQNKRKQETQEGPNQFLPCLTPTTTRKARGAAQDFQRPRKITQSNAKRPLRATPGGEEKTISYWSSREKIKNAKTPILSGSLELLRMQLTKMIALSAAYNPMVLAKFGSSRGPSGVSIGHMRP